MSSSKPATIENECDFSNIKPIEVFKYPSQASEIIWDLNPDNILQSSSLIIDFIKNRKISIQIAFSSIDVFSQIHFKKIKLYAELYQMISNEFSCIIQPKNKELALLLYGERYYPRFLGIKTKEDVLNLYSTNSPYYYIAWNKVDDLKSKFPNLDIDKLILTPLDCAIFHGSELCFNYLKNLGAKYNYYSEKYAVQGGNPNIFMQMIEDGKSFDRMINTALDYRNYEIAKFLKTNFGHTPDSIEECMYFGNYDIASYLLSNGENIDKTYIIHLFLFILIIFYDILFLFIFLIVLWHSLFFIFLIVI